MLKIIIAAVVVAVYLMAMYEVTKEVVEESPKFKGKNTPGRLKFMLAWAALRLPFMAVYAAVVAGLKSADWLVGQTLRRLDKWVVSSIYPDANTGPK